MPTATCERLTVLVPCDVTDESFTATGAVICELARLTVWAPAASPTVSVLPLDSDRGATVTVEPPWPASRASWTVGTWPVPGPVSVTDTFAPLGATWIEACDELPGTRFETVVPNPGPATNTFAAAPVGSPPATVTVSFGLPGTR